jgi:hypothetical protein
MSIFHHKVCFSDIITINFSNKIACRWFMRKEINDEIIYLLKDEEFGEFSISDLESESVVDVFAILPSIIKER